MTLPQQVVDRLSKEPTQTPGWSFGLLLFSGAIFFLSLVVYFGLAWGYGPYLDSQLAQLKAKSETLAKSIPAEDQAKFIAFYSRVANVKAALTNHVVFSRLLSWLEKNTQANVYYSRIAFSGGNQIALTGLARTVADANQQAAIFETAPEVKTMSFTGISFSDANRLWQFPVMLTMDPVSTLRGSP